MATKPTAVNAGDAATAANYNDLCDYAEDIQQEYAPAERTGIWTGTLANIPSGWYLEDGNNGTVNMLDRFIQSVPDAMTDPGTTGGATAKTTSGHYHAQKMSAAGGLSRQKDTSIGSENSDGYDDPMYTTTGVGTMTGIRTGTQSKTDGISDIRPKYYEVAFIRRS